MPASGVALVIPAWREEQAIGPLLGEIPPGCVDAVLVVVGGADDTGTAAAARAAGGRVVIPSRGGYGAACHAGARAAREQGASVVAFLDGDYSDPPSSLPRVLEPILRGAADLALGRRDFTASPGSLPLHARLGNRLVLEAVRWRAGGPRLTDLPSFKALRLDHLEALEMREMTYGWTVEMVVKAIRAGYRISEVPVPYRDRLGGQSKVSGTVRGTLGAAQKMIGCSLQYAAWQPTNATTDSVRVGA